MKQLLGLALILIFALFSFSYIGDKLNLNKSSKFQEKSIEKDRVKVQNEESVVIDAVKEVGPSVVTIVEDLPIQTRESPFSIFGFDVPTETDPEPRSIGSGFIVTKDGLVVTNKHVVSDTTAKYQILTSTDKTYNVERIYRDPLNDVAILKVAGINLKPVKLGESSGLVVGQFVIAIGTALGEFRNTVTTGVISGLGRGITAGSSFQGFAEELDNVIQTDAAINPGNSGGPLLNSSAEVIGVNTAVASGGQNIGFALPINVIKDSLDNFNKTGQFNRAFLGISYRILNNALASQNNLTAGAYIQNIISGSPAEKAGLLAGDVITKIDGREIEEGKFEISSAVSRKKIGDSLTLTVWRDGQIREITATLGSSPNQ